MTSTTAPAAKGHPIGFWFFFWGEFAERCSYYGMRAILTLYMIDRLGVDKGDAASFMALFIAMCYFFPLIGGYIADNFLGKYWTIVLFAVPYVVAQFLVGTENKPLVFGALVLLAMGSGVIKPNISTLMGLTYDQQRPGQEQLRTSAFSWFYMSINIGAALSQFCMPWLRKEYDYHTAFLFPAGLMAASLLIFALGKRFYAKETIVKKVVGRPGETIPDGKTLTGIPIKYQVMSQSDVEADKALKRMVLKRIGALFLLVMFFWAIFDQTASTWILFADTYMDTTVLGKSPTGQSVVVSGETLNGWIGRPTYSMSADQIQFFNPTFIIIFVPLSVAFFKIVKVKATTKMAVGFVLTSLSMVIMGLAGFQSGTQEKMIKATFMEGVLILPNFEDDISKASTVTVKTGKPVAGETPPGAPASVKGPIAATASDARWNTNNKKLEFGNGQLKLTDGQIIEVRNGRATAPLPAITHTTTASNIIGGVRESHLKSAADVTKLEAKPTDMVTLEEIDWVKPQERISVWWQILAYLIVTIAEILISVTGLELAFVAAPQSMKSFVTACWLAVVGFANLVVNVPFTQLYPLMAPGVYFIVLAVAMMITLVLFMPVAAKFNRAMEIAKAETDAREAGTEAV